MKILHVIYSLRNGGAERIVVDLAKGLTNKGHINHICTLNSVNEFELELQSSGVNFTSLINKKEFRFILCIPILIIYLRKVIKDINPDIVHCHLRNDSAICGFIKDIPIIRSIQNSNPLGSYDLSLSNKIILWLEKQSLKKPNFNIVACNKVSENLINLSLEKYRKSCVATIYNAIDTKRFNIKEINKKIKSPFKIILIGTLYKTKNHKMAFLALNELIKSNIDCHLLLIGDGIEKRNLQNMAKELNIKNRVKFLGIVDNISDHLKQSDLYWSTSRSEGFSISNLEAMCMGVPTIVTDVDGNKEMLEPWDEYRIPLDDYKKLATVTIKLLNNPKQLKKTAESMKKHVLDKYNIDSFINKYISVYKNSTYC